MTLRFHIAVAALAATFAFGCGADRAPWVVSGAGDVPEDRAGGELPGDTGGAPVDLLPELVDAAPELVDGVDTAPELVDTAPELGPEVVDATDAVDHVDGADGEICTPRLRRQGLRCGRLRRLLRRLSGQQALLQHGLPV